MNTDIIEMNQTTALATPPAQAPATPADIVLYAMQKGADIAQIEKFMDLQMKWEADQARKAFVSDMAEFKKDPPEIVKDKLVSYSGTNYMHATLGNVTEAIVAGLARCGFSHRWDTEQQGGNIVVTCILTHKLGHSERTSLSAVKDDSGKKNQIQQMASTITYLQRYTLLAATGVATKDQGDDDGAGSELDTTLGDKWIAKVKAANTDADVAGPIWTMGIAEIEKAGDKYAYREFKTAVIARRAEFAQAGAA
jgi:hypothetical protein